MRGNPVWLAFLVIALAVTEANALSDSLRGHAQCLMIGAIGLKWEPVPGATSYVVYRSPDRVAWTPLAEVTRSEYVDRKDLASGAVCFYAVSPKRGDVESEKAILGSAANSANLVAGGDFEMEPLGDARPVCFASMDNASGRLRIVPGTRPGGDGKKILQVTGDASAPIIRLHTPRFWVVPNGIYRVRAWCKPGETGVANLGGDVLNAERRKCDGMVVTYFQSHVLEEGPDGWLLREGWDKPVPKDAATIQLWALGWRTRGPGWFDDLEVLDQRIVDLAACDLAAAQADLRNALSAWRGPEEVRKDAEEILAETESLSQKLGDPNLTVEEVLQVSMELLRAERQLEDIRWDLKILGLKYATGEKKP